MTLRISPPSFIFFVAVVAASYAISFVNGFSARPPITTTTTRLIAKCNPQPPHLCRHSFAPSSLRHTISPQQSSSLNNSNSNINSNINNNLDNDLDNDDTTTSSAATELDDENLTSIGSTEYYQGFLTRSPNEEPIERVTGDAILGPTLKFAGGISLILVVLVLVFLGSNGLIL